MRPDDIGRHGTALLERVRREVDTPRGLDSLRSRHRRVRFTLIAATATAVIAAFFGIALLMRPVEQPPAVPSPLRPLPVEVSIVLLDQFTVDPDGEACRGTGAFSAMAGGQADFIDGAEARAIDDPAPLPVASLTVGAGAVITEIDMAALGIASAPGTACRFMVDATGLGIDDFESLELSPGSLGNPGAQTDDFKLGQRITYTVGGDR